MTEHDNTCVTKVTVVPYSDDLSSLWDTFVSSSRNGTFLHQRAYMDYHRERFPDCSLLFYIDGVIAAILPATRDGKCLYSHRGLTYGGLLYGRSFHARDALAVFNALGEWCRQGGIEKIYYKPPPHIYHRMPAEEDLYALFRFNATLVQRHLSSALFLANSYGYSKGRKAVIKKSQREGIEVVRSQDFATFMTIEESHLLEKHGVRPVHSAAEMELLASRFPDRIHLFAALHNGKMLGGVITYTTDVTCHAQYIGATTEGKQLGALDACLGHILEYHCPGLTWFDFGISTVEQGRVLDEKLVANKESWGARTIVYDHYELQVEK